MNVDVEIYVSQLKTFFENNPNDLIVIIGDSLKEDFFKKVKKQCYINFDKGEDFVLTQQQIIDIVVELKNEEIVNGKTRIVNKIYEQTKFGIICLN